MKTDTNNDTIEINLAKTHASPEKYFALFDMHIANTYNENNTILLYDICNEGCIELIVNKNPAATYIVYDCQEMKDTLPLLIPNVKFIFIDNTKVDNPFEYNLFGMKFDCIIMNPPYQRNLHLKILEKAIEHLKDDNSVCVNLSPVRWLQDPLAQYKKHTDYKRYENSISKHIETLDVILAKTTNELFQINNFTDLGIYKARTKTQNLFNYKEFNELEFNKCKTVIDKILSYVTSNEKNTYAYYITNDTEGYRVVLSMITGQRGEQHLKRFYECGCRNEIFKNGIDVISNKNYADICGGIKRAKAQQNGKTVELANTINFSSQHEAENFIKYCKLNCMTFCGMITKNDMHPQFKFLPWLGNSINPRTGLKGYESEWTDEDFYTFFNITSEEQKIIEETMAKYK